MKNYLLIALLAISMCSCKNYTRELEELSDKCKTEGKEILATSVAKHFIIYKDGDAFWMNNLDEPARKILSADKEMVKVYYNLDFNNNGRPEIKPSFYEMKLGKGFFQASNEPQDEIGYVYPYKKEEVKLLNDEAISFFYEETGDSRGGGTQKYDSKLVYYFSNPDTLFHSRTTPFIYPGGSRPDKVSLYAGFLTWAIVDDIYSHPCNAQMPATGLFSWTFSLDAKGKVIGTDESINYTNEFYGNSLTFNLSRFDSKGRARSVLKTINDTLTACAQRQAEIEKKARIEQLVKESISIKQLSKEYRNTLKANRNYKGKTFTVSCELELLKEARGLFEPDEYKYKVVSYALEAFGEWISGYDILGYTNDENFVELTYPHEVVMEVTLQSGSSGRFEFRDCKLLVW